MTRQVIIESMDGYREAVNHFGECKDVEWLTTSIGLIEKLNSKGVKVESLENSLTKSVQNNIGYAAYEISDNCSNLLNDYANDWRGFIDFKMAFGPIMNHMIYAHIYKGFLIDQKINESDTNQIICVGDPDLSSIKGLNIGIGRLETVYAVLAQNAGHPRLSTLIHRSNKSHMEKLDQAVRNRTMSPWEKIISIINNTPSSFLYKVWRNLERYGVLRSISLWVKPKRNVFFYKDCELLEEIFLEILTKGNKVSKLPKFPKFTSENKTSELSLNKSEFLEQVERTCINVMVDHNITPGTTLNYSCKLISRRLYDLINNLNCVTLDLLEDFDCKRKLLGKNGVVFTNYFSSPIERLFGLYCLDHKIPVVAFEHGVTLGLSEWSKYSSRYSGMLLASTGVYHWDKSLADFRMEDVSQKVLIGGIPMVAQKIILKKVQFLLSRLWLGLSPKKKVVVCVADVERNNYIYGPHKENDLQYRNTTTEIVRYLAKQSRDTTVLLKLYPTLRYNESYKFTHLVEKYKNVRIVKDMDFRFIRATADLICLSSSQSTLGWALGVSCPVWMFEKESTPVRIEGRQLDIQIPGISRVIELDKDPCAQHLGSIMTSLGK